MVSNNEAEYETLITSLRVAKELDIKNIMVFCDSQLVVNQITTAFEAREPRMASYLQVAKDLISWFDSFEITHVPREVNFEADSVWAKFHVYYFYPLVG